MNTAILPCPFCGHVVDLDDPSTLHPDTVSWYNKDGRRVYVNFRSPLAEYHCWVMNCLEEAGGCGATIRGDTKRETLAKWQQRHKQD